MISRRAFLQQVGLGASAIAAASSWAQDSPAKRPNILWIYSDDHAENAISAYGGRFKDVAPTPNIDRLAKEGMLFRNSFVTNSICGPCRAVVLTGLHSHLNGFRKNGDTFDGDQQTFPKLLQQAGYQTAMYGKWHLKSDPQGFDAWEVLPGQGHYYNPDFLTPSGKIQEEGYVTDLITDKALHWLAATRDPAKPFMLMLQHKAPHREWEPGPAHLTTFDETTFPEPENLFDDYAGRGSAAKLQDMNIERTMRMDFDLKMWTADAIEKNRGAFERTLGRFTPEQRAKWDEAYEPKIKELEETNPQGAALVRWKYQRYMQDYLACVRSVDDNVGRVLDYLRDNDLEDNTIVFYSSDQSFYLGEHGWFDKRFIYEESLRTPLLARWPGVIKPGSEAHQMVQNLDCAQTFLALAGVSQPDNMQGRSLLPLLEGKSPADWRSSIYYHYYEGEGKVHNAYVHYGVRTDRYKLVYFYTLDEWEFYDLKTDPKEMKSEFENPAYAKQVAALKDELLRLREEYKVPEPALG